VGGWKTFLLNVLHLLQKCNLACGKGHQEISRE
jgi:hypothetical protein